MRARNHQPRKLSAAEPDLWQPRKQTPRTDIKREENENVERARASANKFGFVAGHAEPSRKPIFVVNGKKLKYFFFVFFSVAHGRRVSARV